MARLRFGSDARAAVLDASREEAEMGGSGVIEAEHLLLALAAHPSLHHLGLDHDELVRALDQEEARSLAAVGVVASDFPERRPPHGRRRRPARLATSAKLALHRGVVGARHRGARRIETGDLLRGVVAAEHGRVPRALEIADVDVERLRAAL